MGFFSRLIGRPTRDDFAHAVMAEMRRISPQTRVVYDRSEFALKFPAEKNHFTNLQNGYQEYYFASRSTKHTVVARWASLPLNSKMDSTAFEDVKDKLLPRVRERSYYSIVKLQFRAKDIAAPDWPHKPLGEYYAVGLAVDYPDTISEPGSDIFKSWPVSYDEAQKIARENLWKRSNEDWLVLTPGLYRSPWRDNLDACRLSLHDLIWQLKVQGNPVAAAPNRDTVLVTGRDDTKGLIGLARVARAAMEEQRFMTAIPLELIGSEWVPLKLEPGHPAENAVRELYALSLQREYGEQKRLLDNIHTKSKVDIFVATYFVTQVKKTGKIQSFCTWTYDCHAYLPRADYFYFVAGEKALGRAAWDEVIALVPELLKPVPDLFPPLFEVTSFPSDEVLAKLDLEKGEA